MTRSHRLLRTFLTRLGFAFGRLRAPRPRVVLATSHTGVLTGNLRFIDEELRARHPDVEIVRLTLRRGGRLGPLAPVLGILRAGFHLAASRVMVVDDYFFPMYVITPRPGTTRIQVWHAAGAFKKFGYSVVDKGFGADPDLIRSVRIHSNYSLALVSSMSIAPHYAEAFGQPGPIFTSRIGVPRTDLFADPERRARAEARVRAAYPLPAGRRVILYAPTFRGSSVGMARYADLLDLEAMHRVLGEDHVLLLKLHPFVRDALTIPPELAAFAIDASPDPDVNELMLISDVLVTDYSSVIYEFSLLGRPIAFLAPDEGAYDVERGFYLDFRRDAPGPIVATTDELAALIRADDFDLERVRAFARSSFDAPPGGASRRLVEWVLIPALAGEQVTAASLEASVEGVAGG
jgi:teichoic acid ribitol-phosphate primase